MRNEQNHNGIWVEFKVRREINSPTLGMSNPTIDILFKYLMT
jgi:hypothetical protein